MDFLKKHKCITSHHTSLLLRIVPHPDTVLCSNGARFVLYMLQLSRSACCFHYATKMHFLACHFLFTQMPAVRHYNIALSLLITSPFALTLQQIFLR